MKTVALLLALVLTVGSGCSSSSRRDAFCGQAKQILNPEALSTAMLSANGWDQIVARLHSIDTSALDAQSQLRFARGVSEFVGGLAAFRRSRFTGLTVAPVTDAVNEICGGDLPRWSIVP